MKTTITKTMTFCAGHRLKDHPGDCRNVHGHTYRIELTVSGEVRENGMIIDFKRLKDPMNGIVKLTLDHAFIYQKGDELGELIAAQGGMKTFCMDVPPTTENIAHHILEYLQRKDVFSDRGGITIEKLRLYEGDSSWAEVK